MSFKKGTTEIKICIYIKGRSWVPPEIPAATKSEALWNSARERWMWTRHICFKSWANPITIFFKNRMSSKLQGLGVLPKRTTLVMYRYRGWPQRTQWNNCCAIYLLMCMNAANKPKVAFGAAVYLVLRMKLSCMVHKKMGGKESC